MLTADQVAAIEAQIKLSAATAENIAGIVAPQYVGFIVLGQAVATALPELALDVQNLIDKKEPTAADTAALAVKIAALADPAKL